jgi:3D (Asp-Asp-Asp) domain-containing protein
MRSIVGHEGQLARGKIILILTLLLLAGLLAEAGTPNASSKSSYSKTSGAPMTAMPDAPQDVPAGRLARVTAYWPGEDYYTNHKMSATGVRLRPGFCAVDSRIIPYGSVVTVSGVGSFLAMDTGTAVVSRKAARESGHNKLERSALVIDLYFASRKAAAFFDRNGPKFAMIAWGSGALASN